MLTVQQCAMQVGGSCVRHPHEWTGSWSDAGADAASQEPPRLCSY